MCVQFNFIFNLNFNFIKMLEKIKSSFIIKKVFNCLDLTIKFNTIVYNKNLQKKLGLTINNFKRFSGRYKEEKYGQIKEYDSYSHKLIFEGEYSNGKRNGRGKEYNEDCELIFIGEYLNGKKWKGIKREYDEVTGILILECEYLNGKIDGKAE